MSKWSYCDAILSIYTYREIPDFEKVVNKMLENAPKITGSEGDCDYLAIDYISGSSTNKDCVRCAFFNLKYGILNKHGEKILKGCPGFPYANNRQLKKCEEGMYIENGDYIDRCRVVITSHHGLRDKSKEDTTLEFNELIKYLKSYKNKLFEIEVLCKKIK